MGARLTVWVLGGVQRLMGGLAGLLARLAPERYAPTLHWAAPQGEHGVGTAMAQITDAGRADPHGAGPRRLPLRVWYPATVDRAAKGRPLMTGQEVDALAPGMTQAMPLSRFMLKRLGSSETWSHDNAPVAQGRCPVAVFNPGFGGIAAQNWHLAEQLASAGYIVIAVDHVGAMAATGWPDGTGQAMQPALRKDLFQPELLRAAIGMKKSKDLDQRLAALRDYLAFKPLADEGQVWLDDLASVLDALAGETDDETLQRLRPAMDLDRIGVLGMSFGGAASAQFAHQDARVRAAINLDGGQFHDTLLDAPIRVPLLMVHSRFAASFADGGGYNDLFYEPWAQAGKTGRVWRYVVEDSGHLDFTDMTLFGHGLVAKLLGLGGIEGTTMLNLTAELCTRFLDSHLKEDAEAWPADVPQRWPQLQAQDCAPLRRWASQRD